MRVHKPHKNFDQWVSESDRLLNVTCNGISVIYVTAHISAGRLKRRWDIRSGSNRQRYVVVFFNVSVQAPTRGQPFYGYSEKSAHLSRILRRAWGYREPIVVLHPKVPTEELQAACEGKTEQGLSPSLLNLVLWCFGGFVCFVLCPCFGSEYLPNPSFKENLPAFACNTKHTVPNIHTHVSWI